MPPSHWNWEIVVLFSWIKFLIQFCENTMQCQLLCLSILFFPHNIAGCFSRGNTNDEGDFYFVIMLIIITPSPLSYFDIWWIRWVQNWSWKAWVTEMLNHSFYQAWNPLPELFTKRKSLLKFGLRTLGRLAIFQLSLAWPTATPMMVTGCAGARTETWTARTGRLVRSGLVVSGRAESSCSRKGLVTSAGTLRPASSCLVGRAEAKRPRRSSRTESVSRPSLSDIKSSLLVQSGRESIQLTTSSY